MSATEVGRRPEETGKERIRFSKIAVDSRGRLSDLCIIFPRLGAIVCSTMKGRRRYCMLQVDERMQPQCRVSIHSLAGRMACQGHSIQFKFPRPLGTMTRYGRMTFA